MTPTIGVLSNPYSGRNLKYISNVDKVLSRYSNVIHNKAREPESISLAVSDFADKGAEILVINGGDGTIQAVLTSLFYYQQFKELPLLALLHGGSNNLISRDVGLSGPPDQALRRLCSKYRNNGVFQAVDRHILRLDLPGPAERRILYGMFLGSGLLYTAVSIYLKSIRRFRLIGEFNSVLAIGYLLLSLAVKGKTQLGAGTIKIGYNEHPLHSQDYMFFLTTTLQRLIFGLRPWWGSQTAPLKFTLVRSDYRSLAGFTLSLLTRFKKTLYKNENDHISQNLHQLRIGSIPGLVLDGELIRPPISDEPILIRDGGVATFLIDNK